MTRSPLTPQERYEDLVDELSGERGVEPPPGGSGFGRGALRHRRKIFAMFVRGQLVLSCPGRASTSLSARATACGSTLTRTRR